MDAMDGLAPHLSVVSTGGGGVSRLVVSGEIDMTTGDAFRQDVLGALDAPGLRRLLVDVAGVGFVDSHGVSVLLQARRVAAERGVAFAVVDAPAVLRSVLEMLGVQDLLGRADVADGTDARAEPARDGGGATRGA